MSGVTTPPVIVEAFAINGAKNVIPVDSQIPITPGAASYNDGFPPLNMTAPSSGGIPPSGLDMNGILYAVSAHAAAAQGGQLCYYSADFVAFNGGYKLGAMLAKLDNTGFWFNLVDNNATDPDTGGADWVGWSPTAATVGYLSAAVPAGVNNDFAPAGFGFSINTLDLDPNAGDATITTLQAGADGQRIVVTNINGVNKIDLPVLTGPTAANQFRGAAAITLLGDMSIQIQYSAGVSKWLLIP